MRRMIGKSDWLKGLGCRTSAWYQLRGDAPIPSEASLFRMEQGIEIGDLARTLYPTGVLIASGDRTDRVAATQRSVADPATIALFEGTFVAGWFVAKADVLLRSAESGWHLLEVKSNFADTEKLPALIDDLAYTAMVLRRSGLHVTRTSLLLLSREYRHGMDAQHLFESVEVNEEVNERVVEFEAFGEELAASILDPQRPHPKLGPPCRSCEYFTESCLGRGHQHTVLELPSLHKNKLAELSDAGIVSLADLPGDFVLTDRQSRVKKAARDQRTFVSDSLVAALESIQWPCRYLDFETVATALPLYEGHGCHQQVLSQFSVHHRERLDGPLSHTDFLAEAIQLDEKALAIGLLEALGQNGSILVYSNFEKTRINGIKAAFPELGKELDKILSRLVDLLAIVTSNVYHPEFRGSYSIKKVLPALVPDLSYDDMPIPDGETAVAYFARMARGEISGPEAAMTRSHLRDYCKMDTLAMVRLHDALVSLTVTAT